MSRRCPICNKATDQAWRPFCSKRCADADLHKWFTGGYAVPVIEEDDVPNDPSGENDEG